MILLQDGEELGSECFRAKQIVEKLKDRRRMFRHEIEKRRLVSGEIVPESPGHTNAMAKQLTASLQQHQKLQSQRLWQLHHHGRHGEAICGASTGTETTHASSSSDHSPTPSFDTSNGSHDGTGTEDTLHQDEAHDYDRTPRASHKANEKKHLSPRVTAKEGPVTIFTIPEELTSEATCTPPIKDLCQHVGVLPFDVTPRQSQRLSHTRWERRRMERKLERFFAKDHVRRQGYDETSAESAGALAGLQFVGAQDEALVPCNNFNQRTPATILEHDLLAGRRKYRSEKHHHRIKQWEWIHRQDWSTLRRLDKGRDGVSDIREEDLEPPSKILCRMHTEVKDMINRWTPDFISENDRPGSFHMPKMHNRRHQFSIARGKQPPLPVIEEGDEQDGHIDSQAPVTSSSVLPSPRRLNKVSLTEIQFQMMSLARTTSFEVE